MRPLLYAVLEFLLIFVLGTALIFVLVGALGLNIGVAELGIITLVVLAIAIYRGIRRYRVTKNSR
ncbi:Uncharacterised protein [Corynebacterium renale]|uniref:hypothetical protein n=1 Tax=Corynebacterium renale TaxID=1724 RepID=UPI000DA2827D|nr:hypothetical protein [Corynebacterium renale]SQG63928.1 Uncharacterised protein [Corynebacterium renale]STD02993.1 Uncharacterised protein [Corynebacterium renale]